MKPDNHAMAANRPQEALDRNSSADEMMKDETTNDGCENSTESDESGMHAAPTGPNTYTVLSGETAYSVDVAQKTCTCGDYVYRCDDEGDTCKHLQHAIRMHPHPDAEYEFRGGRVSRVDVTQSGAPSREEAEAVEETEAAITESPEDAHDRLETSLRENTSIKFKTHLDDDRIWFGFDEYVEEDGAFGKYISGPEMVEYDPDNSPDGFKNYIAPGDVDAYISEVLE